ncbi:MAG: UDP-3-O-acyl-N-acetylglucosamine deacetylase [Alphaproteobacteria bacterium]|nr:UDP-3-O-acyl-N-acetylglucosamine deacetylase [Alphaproteobacteria bacterium]MCL2757719.1 UDP-3-O-acyl-N-acetylglucosamine deacetylase [Alphaproteobacteria bacterium]
MASVKKEIKFSGVGIHSGIKTKIVIKPGTGAGIFFKRTDIKGAKPIPASYENVFDITKFNTTIGEYPNQAQTIEHLMAALFIAGIDSAIIEIDGPEMPIMDGSAKEFTDAILAVQKAAAVSKKIIVKKEIVAHRREITRMLPLLPRIMLWLHNLKIGRRENGYVKLSPNPDGLLIKATLDYPDKIIGIQSAEFFFDGTGATRKKFIKDFARSRTFGRIWEWEYLKKRGMGLGANLDNVIAIDQTGAGTINKLYSPDEFVRHKIVDAIGDMFTSKGFISGTLESYKGSHGLNNLVLRKLFSNPDNYEIVNNK